MRWIPLLVLWVVAVVAAVLILRRVRRGKPVVLAGRWSPRLVRMIVVVLVVLGVGDEPRLPQAAAAPVKLPIRTQDDELPVTVAPHLVETWLAIQHPGGPHDLGKKALARALAADRLTPAEADAVAKQLHVPEMLQGIARADLTAKVEGKTAKVSVADLNRALTEVEHYGRFDHFWNAYLWRRSATAEFPDPAARIELYARFRKHARITDALILAHARVKPMMQGPRAWASKAGPQPEERQAIAAYRTSLDDMLAVVKDVLPTTDEGTWKRDGVVRLKPVAGSPAPKLIRGGRERVMPADEPTRFGRLDLFQTGDQPAVVMHDWLGKIEIPARRLVSVWELPDLLPEAAKQKLDATVLDAMKTNAEAAADRLEECLPLSHRAIRAGLAELPMRAGAPRLRLILALFDDTVMPVLPTFARPAVAERGVTAPGGGPPGRR